MHVGDRVFRDVNWRFGKRGSAGNLSCQQLDTNRDEAVCKCRRKGSCRLMIDDFFPANATCRILGPSQLQANRQSAITNVARAFQAESRFHQFRQLLSVQRQTSDSRETGFHYGFGAADPCLQS